MKLSNGLFFKNSQPLGVALVSLLLLLPSMSQAKELVVATGNFAPYFKQEGVQGQGYFDRVVITALKRTGIKKFKVIPLDNPAIDRYFISANADVAINLTSMQPPPDTYPSKYLTRFMNRIIMHDFPWAKHINSLVDLQGLKVASFPGAGHLFGAQFVAASKRYFQNYYETTDQHALNRQLLTGKIDVRAGDYLMFYWYLTTHSKRDPKEFIIQDILNYDGSYIVFQNEQLRDDFDDAMAAMIASGEFSAITSQWLDEYQLPNTQHQFFLVQ